MPETRLWMSAFAGMMEPLDAAQTGFGHSPE
jgi:hypothetical protein